MANQEHLAKLKESLEKKDISIWNKWRTKKKEIIPDLSGINLDYKNLNNIDLNNANLEKVHIMRTSFRNAKFQNANLSFSQFYDVSFRGANMSETNLSYADLGRRNYNILLLEGAVLDSVNLSNSNLSGANLKGASLKETNLLKADLSRTNFEDCTIGNTIFGLTDLSTVRNIDKVKVSNICTIDFPTLKNSKNIPRAFLLKIGLPETYVEYLPDFYDEKPIRLHPVFLSHSWKDKPFATKLYEALTARKVLVWYDERKLKAGDDIRKEINEGINLYDKFILICSENSLENSWWVDKEINRALDKEARLFKEKGKQINTIIPLTVDNYVFEKWDSPKKSDINRYLIGDFKNWQDDNSFNKEVDKLIHVLNADRENDVPPSFF